MARAQPAPANQPDFPTPDELRAFFYLLRELGWKPGNAHPVGPPANTPPRKGTKLPTKEQVDTVFAFAREMGWISVNGDELALIKNLRLTTYKGRHHVYETAAAMRRHRPWVFEGDTAHNTEV